MNDQSQHRQPIAVIAVAPNGSTYRIERRSQFRSNRATPDTYFYCCLPDGQVVDQIGTGIYQLPDGTIVRTRRRRGTHPDGASQ